MEQIGVRELRQHASRYLARVSRGEILEVTDRGRPVARLTPVPVADEWDQMIADGRIIPPQEPGSVLDIKPVKAKGRPPSEILAEMRESERW